MEKSFKFPENFYWGASTSSYQVEGNVYNNWSVWEKRNKEKLVSRGKKAYASSFFDPFRAQIEDTNNYISGSACDHYNRYEEDFDLLKELNLNSYRFSIEWSRIEPSEGNYDEKEIQHYVEIVRALKSRGIEPFVTLWHWSIPAWLSEQGGWANKKTSIKFMEYVKVVEQALGKDVRFWITLNEPMIYSSNAYGVGVWPPQKINPVILFQVLKNLRKGHVLAYEVCKKGDPKCMVGIAKNNAYFDYSDRPLFIKPFITVCKLFWNELFLKSISKYQDFIGLNHYTGYSAKEPLDKSDLGWKLYPEGIYYVLKDLEKYGKPIYITEHGLADGKDTIRWKYTYESLKYVHKAIEEGVDVKGYMHWSLMDNFEWDKGFWPRLGLLEIDYSSNLKRSVRDSAKRYSEIAKSNKLHP